MKTFSELVQRYHDWTLEVNYDSNLTNNSQYIWEIPAEALEEWKHALDDYADQFTEHTLEIYKNMFQVGNQLLGILVGCISNDNYVRLHKLNKINVDWHFTKVLCSDNINILDQNGISNTIELSTGKQVILPIVLNAHTLQTNSVFDLVDSRFNKYGVCIGEKYQLQIREHNRLNKESWMATIDYANGNFHLIRSHTENEKKFINYYNMLIQVIGSIGTRTITNAAGVTSSVRTISFVPSNVTPYDYVSPSGTIEALTGPSSIMFQWDINDEEKEPEALDTMINNIQDSIASGKLTSPEFINAAEAQNLYESLMRNNNENGA